jgi:trehalose 6-phosphate synthase
VKGRAVAASPAPLVVVSNRLPYNAPRQSGNRPPKRNVGGLVNALEPVLASRGGCWIGWDGVHLPSAGAVTSSLAHPLAFRSPSGIPLHGVPLSEREVSRYYRGFSNRALWPLFHSFLYKSYFGAEDYAAYVGVNRRFAELVLAKVSAKSRIWVHDFHLMQVPYFLRELGFRGQIDFFLHIPFPAPEIFRALPWREELIRGLLAADTVAFHVGQYRENFIAAAEQLLEARRLAVESRGRMPLRSDQGKTTTVVAPIGIDVDEFERLARLPAVEARAMRIRESHRECRIILGADRLDYTKGIKERVKALEQYLKMRPEAARHVVLIQVVVPSRDQVEEYRVMKREIDEEIGRINGEYGREGWVPIHYLYRGLDREELVAYYRAADVALVTPLRDGMNLVAAEYAASRVDGDGTLIISEFAGISSICDGAILVNPFDLHGTARAISSALDMEEVDRRGRMKLLRRSIRANNLSKWAERCLGLAEIREAPVRVKATGFTFSQPLRDRASLKPLRPPKPTSPLKQ